MSQIEIYFARAWSPVPKVHEIRTRFGEPAIGQQRFGQTELHVRIIGSIGKGIPEILECLRGFPGRQVRISLLKPFRNKAFLARMIRPGKRGRDSKQQRQQDQAEQQHAPFYISRYDILGLGSHNSKITQLGSETHGFM